MNSPRSAAEIAEAVIATSKCPKYEESRIMAQYILSTRSVLLAAESQLDAAIRQTRATARICESAERDVRNSSEIQEYDDAHVVWLRAVWTTESAVRALRSTASAKEGE